MQILEIRITTDDLSDALFYYMDYEQQQELFKTFLVWDECGVDSLIKTLKLWVNLRLEADKVGEFLENALYQRDEHMENLVTTMVDKHESYTSIAFRVMQYYCIHDISDRPAWEIMPPGDINRHAGFKPLTRALPPRGPIPNKSSFYKEEVSVNH